MTKDELLEKMFNYMEEEKDANGKTCKDFPKYEVIKNSILEQKDKLNEKILLMGDILEAQIYSAVKNVQYYTDNCRVAIDNNTFYISSYRSVDKKHYLTQTTITVSDDYPNTDVNMTHKFAYTDEKNHQKYDYPCDITWYSIWYDSKTGKEISLSEIDVKDYHCGYGLNPDEIEKVLLSAGGSLKTSDPMFGYQSKNDATDSYEERILNAKDTKYPGVNYYSVETGGKRYYTYEPQRNGRLWSEFFSKGESQLKETTEKFESMSEKEKDEYLKFLSARSEEIEFGDYGLATERLGLDELRKSGDAKLNSGNTR